MEDSDLELEGIDIINEGIRNINIRLHDVSKSKHMNSFLRSIYMAPDVLRNLSPSSFNPRVVSIGPLHREDENVQAFEMEKGSYLHELMRRIELEPLEILESCMQKAYDLIDKIKASYVWTKTYRDVEICEMMVMDACFILEFAHHICIYEEKSYMGRALLAKNICHDLVLLENQIPFFFLHEIFQCTILKFRPDVSLIQFIHPVLSIVNIFGADINVDESSIDSPHHILSLLHQCYKPPIHIMSFSRTTTIHSGVDLERAGVNFKPNKNPKWVIEMEVRLSSLLSFVGFWGKPTLKMPILLVYDRTELVLRNLIAYEQSFQTKNHITSYVIAMDMLVKTQEDVAKLVQSSVLVNNMGTNEEVASLINNINKEVVMEDFIYSYQWEALHRYWNTNIAWVRRTYFIGPWNIISLLAGIILFFLTVVQTLFTIMPVGSNK